MTGAERGFLLLTCSFGDPQRPVLTMAQLRTLSLRMQGKADPGEARELEESDLRALGYDGGFAHRILQLLSEEERLDAYLRSGKKRGCFPLSRISGEYPESVRKALGLEAPGCLWAKGELSLLREKKVALVGSRDLAPINYRFAEEVGFQAARQGYVLVSGNARGADRVAQESCLAAGGSVICVVADELQDKPSHDRILYLSEDDFDTSFSAQRALSRNRVIHSLGACTFVAQCSLETGGTWSGTVKNLRFGYSPVYCYDDGSEAVARLEQMGAISIDIEALKDFFSLPPVISDLFTMK